MRLLLTAILLVSATSAAAQSVPQRCAQHRAEIVRSAHHVFGPTAPVSTLAAQIQQESSCNPEARSRVGALGFAQFMPATAEDMAARFPAECAPANPMSVRWAVRCRDRYMKSLLSAIRAKNEEERWPLALSAYNGGLGWVYRDQKVCRDTFGCDDEIWWGHVELHNDPRRARWAVAENKDYPRRIVCVISPRYASAGWGRAIHCPESPP